MNPSVKYSSQTLFTNRNYAANIFEHCQRREIFFVKTLNELLFTYVFPWLPVIYLSVGSIVTSGLFYDT